MASQTIHWEAGAEAPREERLLAFGAITYIYEPENEDVGGVYSEVAGRSKTCWALVSCITNTAIATEYDRWLTCYRARNIQRISLGICIIRKPLAGEPGWRRSDARHLRTFHPQAGSDVDAVMRNETWLRQAQPGTDTLLDTIFTPVAGLAAQAQMSLRSHWQKGIIELQSPGLLAYNGQVDGTILRLLELAAQDKPARALVTALQAKVQSGAQAAVPDEIAGIVRNLLSYGLITK